MKTGETGQMKDKKKLAAAGILAVVLTVAAGCSGRSPRAGSTVDVQGVTQDAQNAQNTQNTQDTQNTQNTQNTQDVQNTQNAQNTQDAQSTQDAQAGVSPHDVSGQTAMVSGGITQQEAKEIALREAGVSETDISYITVKQDWDDGTARYEVEFVAYGTEYDYELDATDGRVISASSEIFDKMGSTSQGTAQQGGTSTAGGISIDTAKQTVMDRIPGIDARNIYLYPDSDDGMFIYEGEAYHAETKYEFEISASDGRILSWEAESIYD